MFTKDSWIPTEPLPRAIAGAASIGLDGKVWVFGGVVEEDYYDLYATKEDSVDVLEAFNCLDRTVLA